MIYCFHGTLDQSALLLKSIIWLVSFAALLGRSCSFRGSVDYHLASAMDSQSRTKGTCIVFVDCWCNFIYLF